MAEDTVERVFIKSVLSTYRFFVVLGMGIVASKWPKGEPLLTREVSRNFSRVGMDLFLPCLLLSSVGGTLNPAALRDSWHLVVGSTLSIGISNSLASGFGWLLMRRDARQTFRPVQMAIAFPNSLVFPLILLGALCEQDVINGDHDGDSVECYEQASSMIFIYVAVWQVWFFAWGFYCLKNDNALEVSLTNQPAAAAAVVAAAAAAIPDDPENPLSSRRITDQPLADELPRYEDSNETSNKKANGSSTSITTSNSTSIATFYPHSAGKVERNPFSGRVSDSTHGSISTFQAPSGAGKGASSGNSNLDPAATTSRRTQAAAGDQASSISKPGTKPYGGEPVEAKSDATANAERERERGGGVKTHHAGSDASPSAGASSEGQVVPSPLHNQRAATTKAGGGEREASSGWLGLTDNGGSRVVDSSGVIATGSDSGSEDLHGIGGFWARAKHRAWSVVVSPVILALIGGIVICVIGPLQDMLFHNPDAFLRPLGGAIQAVGVPTVPVSTLVMAGSLVAVSAAVGATPTPGGDAESAFPIWRRSRFVMGALLIFLRLIMIPAAFFGLFWLAKTQSSVMGENRLMHLILLIEFAMPSASLMISVLNQIRMPSTAGFLSQLFVWQFAASSVTVSCWTALAINMLY